MTETVLIKNKETQSNTNSSGNFIEVHKSTCHSKITSKELSILRLKIAAIIATALKQEKKIDVIK